ncbi:60S ribosome subunit biogenesis protein NIP7 homolog [Strongyloides ratti]|uniref:60S ribosome subunit biogenesis protein NIP7 homolog n=1 Tax=Strongyloides ratti TaxID=34506 RepID=A0A090KUU9_STRRB|nr:60S ribosome subunit biogenesis protein NIP7 homolog [Strongyloides ratti]CEF61270.1 60S ribosome subunit biogenesis protein NIP7 homolog [Strongyloides ratti]
MRPLTEQEGILVFSRLKKYIGESLANLLEREDGKYVFRYHNNRVFYATDVLMKAAMNIERKQVLSFGTCVGKFTGSGKFYLKITALNIIAPLAKHKVWLKDKSDIQFTMGNNVLKSHITRMTDGIEVNDGVVVFSRDNIPLGFGICQKSTTAARDAPPTSLIVLRYADIGEYIRCENEIIQ